MVKFIFTMCLGKFSNKIHITLRSFHIFQYATKKLFGTYHLMWRSLSAAWCPKCPFCSMIWCGIEAKQQTGKERKRKDTIK